MGYKGRYAGGVLSRCIVQVSGITNHKQINRLVLIVFFKEIGHFVYGNCFQGDGKDSERITYCQTYPFLTIVNTHNPSHDAKVTQIGK